MSDPTQKRPHWPLWATFFSGSAALVFETIWMRAFSIVLGSTVQAAAVTFAAFITALALGAFLFGRLMDRVKNPIHTYIGIEVGIAFLGAGTGLLLHHYWELLIPFLTTQRNSPWYLFHVFGLVLTIISPATVCMGATLPALFAALPRRYRDGDLVSKTYFANTIGGAVGAILCGFFWIRLLGITPTLALAGVLNLLSASMCVYFLRGGLLPEKVARETAAEAELAPSHASEWMLLSISFLSGFSIFSFEVLWSRLGSYFVGNRIYASSTLLSSILLLLAAGSWLNRYLLRRFHSRINLLLPWVLSVSVLLTAFSCATTWWWIQHQAEIERLLPAVERLVLFYRYAQTLILMAPILVPLGCLFPLTLACSRSFSTKPGTTTGRFYLTNTAGAVLGSLFTGFWGISAIGTFPCVIVLLIAIGLAALFLFFTQWRKHRTQPALLGMGFSALSLVAAPLLVPPSLTLLQPEESLVYRKEDSYGVLQVSRLPNGLLRTTNNRTELVFYLGLVETSYVQQMQAHLGMFFLPKAETALVLGSGYGITAGAFSVYPDLQRIDAVEVIPGMIEAADLFEPYNFGYHRNPRVKVIQDDGRHFLARSNEKYDVISVNVSDPHLPGGSALFHSEFYDVVKSHLAPRGVMVQHAFGRELKMILATIQASFPYTRLYPAYGNGFNVVAAEYPLEIDKPAVEKLVKIPSVQKALEGIGIVAPIDPILFMAKGERINLGFDIDHFIASDERPRLEFAWSNASDLLFINE